MLDAPIDSQATPKTEIDWYRSAPWFRLISKSIAISFRSTHLLACALGLLLVLAGDYISIQLFGTKGSGQISAQSTEIELLKEMLLGNAEIQWGMLSNRSQIQENTAAFDVAEFTTNFVLFSSPLSGLTQIRTVNELARSLFKLLIFLSVWAFIGGMIMRRSVVELGCQTSSGWGPAFKIVRGRFLSFLWSFGTPIVGVLVLSIFPLLLGLLARATGVDSAVTGILGVFGIGLSVVIGWMFAIAVLGFPLAWAAIVTERRADAFDGLSRSAAYIFQKPFTVFLCVAVGLLAYFAGNRFVEFAFNSGLQIYLSGFDLGSGNQSQIMLSEQNGYLQYGIAFVLFLKTVYPISLFWTGCSASYLVLRREVDNTDFDDMEMNEFAPATEGESTSSTAKADDMNEKENADS